MKLARQGTMMLLISSCLLLLSCKQKTGLEIATGEYKDVKGFRSVYTVKMPDKEPIEIKATGSVPARFRIEGPGFEVVCNEKQGYYEALLDKDVYDLQPNYIGAQVGTGKLVPRDWLMSGPGIAAGPEKLGQGNWKREPDVDGNEKYSKTWDSGMGAMLHIEIVVAKDGRIVSYLSPSNALYTFKKLERLDQIPIEEFQIEPKEGAICFRTEAKIPSIVTGIPLRMETFDKGANLIEGYCLIVAYDAEAYDATALKKWLSAYPAKGQKLLCTRGPGSDPLSCTPDSFDETFSSSPTIILTNAEHKIVGLWMGFDPAQTKEMETEIRNLILEHT